MWRIAVMSRKTTPLALACGIAVVTLALCLAGAGPAAAGKGGCPNNAAENGAEHANAKSAHSPEKQAQRGCATEDPAPQPNPTPGPTDEADVQVVDVTMSTPIASSFEKEFVVQVGTRLMNGGPADVVLVTTFSFTGPSDCTVFPEGPVVVEDGSLPEGVSVFISRGWLVTCLEPGAHELTANVSVAIDPTEAVSDPDLGNNTKPGNITVPIGS
jgi:hypothetical protein